MIATDLLSRGIDFLRVNFVLNYDFPQSIVSYIHRIGWTGRAGQEGTAVTLYTDDDAPFIRSIANLMKKSGADVPDWMLNLKPPTRKEWKEREKKPPWWKTISTDQDKNSNKKFIKMMKKWKVWKNTNEN